MYNVFALDKCVSAKTVTKKKKRKLTAPSAQFTTSTSPDNSVHHIGLDDSTGTFRGSVYLRQLARKPIYYVRLKVIRRELANGQRFITYSLKTDNLDLALERARSKLANMHFAEERQVSLKPTTVADAIDQFIKAYEAGLAAGASGYTGAMLRGFRKTIMLYWKPYIGTKTLNAVTVGDMAGYEVWRLGYAKNPEVQRHANAKETASPRTLQWEINAFKQMLRWCSQRGMYSGKAYEWRYKVANKERRSALTLGQYRALYRYMRTAKYLHVGKHGNDSKLERHRHLLRAYILFMANTGLRVGEARYLKWEDIEETTNTRGQVVIGVRVAAEESKVRKSRTAIGRHTAKLALDRWRQYCDEHNNDERKPHYFIFARDDGTPFGDLREGFRTVLAEAGIAGDSKGRPFTPYCLRHTYISFRIRFGKNISVFKLAKNCGTSVAMIEQYYADNRPQDFVDDLTM